tara:strand:- start:60 stop:233 length:174 start_codon:yes stop_codon:yes gene_type:complete
MPVTNTHRTTDRYRITLEVCVENDFNPQQIDWRKVLDLQDNESVNSYTESLSIPDRY